ncbi:unnamed protein product [Blepharisma stoltei]|uniref:Anti-sigma-28 factor FlgM C-terminal domain-containing protein n=1 Tax=Blepharisma stoltei TaxID=1481888 RepID=A0AAU9IIB6_9CILI|nr:unnamed protein product [Blepharisma stoltei]
MGCGKASKNITAPVSNTVTPAASTNQENQEVRVDTNPDKLTVKHDENIEGISAILEQAEALKIHDEIYDPVVDQLIQDLNL